MATNVSNCTPKITMKKTRDTKFFLEFIELGKQDLQKWDMLHYIQTYCLFPKGVLQQQSHLRINNLLILLPNQTSWKLFVHCKLVTSVKDKLGHKIIIWKSTDAPVAHNLWTVGWQVLHFAAAEKVQHTLVWKQKKKELYTWLWNMYVAEQTNFQGLNYLSTFRWKTFWILENLPMHYSRESYH